MWIDEITLKIRTYLLYQQINIIIVAQVWNYVEFISITQEEIETEYPQNWNFNEYSNFGYKRKRKYGTENYKVDSYPSCRFPIIKIQYL